MTLTKINVTVTGEAKEVLTAYQAVNGCPNLDSALEAFLLAHQDKASKEAKE